MKRLIAIWALSLGILAAGLLQPSRATAGMNTCVLMTFLDNTWQCEFEAERILLKSCGRCLWLSPDDVVWVEACTDDAPDGCIMIDPEESCGEPEEYCEDAWATFEDPEWLCEGLIAECSG